MADDRVPGARRTGDDQADGVEVPAAATAEAPVEPRTPLTQQIGRAVVAVVVILFLIFAFANSQPVTFNWIFGRSIAVDTAEGVVGGIPLILLLLAAFFFGMVVGAGLLWRSRRVPQAPVAARPSRRVRRGEQVPRRRR
ncbi:MAG: hypothetical protein M3252_00080 [Actinomycetota bacterium]|nr:hypothetical protein [Actinomycetota bacterium]